SGSERRASWISTTSCSAPNEARSVSQPASSPLCTFHVSTRTFSGSRPVSRFVSESVGTAAASQKGDRADRASGESTRIACCATGTEKQPDSAIARRHARTVRKLVMRRWCASGSLRGRENLQRALVLRNHGQADVSRARLVVRADASANRFLVAPGDQRVDQTVAASARKIGVHKAVISERAHVVGK